MRHGACSRADRSRVHDTARILRQGRRNVCRERVQRRRGGAVPRPPSRLHRSHMEASVLSPSERTAPGPLRLCSSSCGGGGVQTSAAVRDRRRLELLTQASQVGLGLRQRASCPGRVAGVVMRECVAPRPLRLGGEAHRGGGLGEPLGAAPPLLDALLQQPHGIAKALRACGVGQSGPEPADAVRSQFAQRRTLGRHETCRSGPGRRWCGHRRVTRGGRGSSGERQRRSDDDGALGGAPWSLRT